MNDRLNDIALTKRANVLAFHSQRPSLIDSSFQLAFKPGPTVADAAAITFFSARRPAEFYGSYRLRIANIAKNELSDAHDRDFLETGGI